MAHRTPFIHLLAISPHRKDINMIRHGIQLLFLIIILFEWPSVAWGKAWFDGVDTELKAGISTLDINNRHYLGVGVNIGIIHHFLVSDSLAISLAPAIMNQNFIRFQSWLLVNWTQTGLRLPLLLTHYNPEHTLSFGWYTDWIEHAGTNQDDYIANRTTRGIERTNESVNGLMLRASQRIKTNNGFVNWVLTVTYPLTNLHKEFDSKPITFYVGIQEYTPRP